VTGAAGGPAGEHWVASVTTRDTVAPGVTYTCLHFPRGPWLVHVAAIDLRTPGHRIDGVRAMDRREGRERVSGMMSRLMARGETPLVAINADFFDLATGEVENNHVVRGEWVKGALETDSPHDEFDNPHTQVAVDARGMVRVGRFALDGEVRGGATTQRLVGINYRPPSPAGLVLYTPWYGAQTLRDSTHAGPSSPGSASLSGRPRDPAPPPAGATVAPASAPSVAQRRADSARRESRVASRNALEVGLRRVGRRGDTLFYQVRRTSARTGGGSSIPSDGAVLSATGDEARLFVRRLTRRGGTIRVVAALGTPRFVPQAAVGGWPRVVLDGVNVGNVADSLEGTFPRFSAGRHPRSAIALSRDSTQLLLIVVDGRRPWSVGMSLAELGDLLIALGAGQGMNLDGGGSSALWVAGRVVNYPSDPGGERAVGNALVVRRVSP